MVDADKKAKELGIVSLVRKRYYSTPENEFEKWVDDLISYVDQTRSNLLSLNDILDLTARMMYRLFSFQEIAIGLRSDKDGLYRYETLLGFTKEAQSAYKELVYNYDDMTTDKKYPFTRMSKHAFFCAVEQQPFEEGEEVTFNRPLKLQDPRESGEDFAEGDYFEFHCYDSNNELISWFEMCNPRSRKMPTHGEIRNIELFSHILGMIIERKKNFDSMYDGDIKR